MKGTCPTLAVSSPCACPVCPCILTLQCCLISNLTHHSRYKFKCKFDHKAFLAHPSSQSCLNLDLPICPIFSYFLFLLSATIKGSLPITVILNRQAQTTAPDD